jgi:hypothetical protein
MMTSTLPLVTASLNKHVTTARVNSGKVEVIIKQKRYYNKGYSSILPLVTIVVVTFSFNDDFNFTTSNTCCSNVFV